MPSKGKDLTNQRFGRLLVISLDTTSVGKCKAWMWNCLCDCGNTSVVRGAHLRNGFITSCGCFSKERHITHGIASLDKRFYYIYKSVISRCTNPDDINYPKYGGKGVSVCDRWLDILCFKEDMYDAYVKASEKFIPTIDRIRVSGEYSKDNCQWVPIEAQAQRRGRFSTNTSGVKGVYKVLTKTGYSYWVAFWSIGNRETKRKSFSVCKYGEEAAFKMACSHRKNMILKLNEEHGMNYDISQEGQHTEWQYEEYEE